MMTFYSNSIEDRIADLHAAFKDPNVKGILAAVEGYNANHLLRYMDYDLIQANPKVICGYGDITAILLAIYKKTGLTTYVGPNFSSLGMKSGLDYTIDYFKKSILEHQANLNLYKVIRGAMIRGFLNRRIATFIQIKAI